MMLFSRQAVSALLAKLQYGSGYAEMLKYSAMFWPPPANWRFFLLPKPNCGVLATKVKKNEKLVLRL